jgi:hypothetical protein
MYDFIVNLIRHYWETTKHKGRVAVNLMKVCREIICQTATDAAGSAYLCARLIYRACVHDMSKYGPQEAPIFAKMTPKLKDTTYGSEEYQTYKSRLGDALQHHYAHNTHHPEHYDGTVGSMDHIDVVEMLCDWEAATHRHEDGDLKQSLKQNADQYQYDENTRRSFWDFYRSVGIR